MNHIAIVVVNARLRLFVSHTLQKSQFPLKMYRMRNTIRLPNEIGEEIKARRVAAGLSISEVSKRAGRSRAVIYRIERGGDASTVAFFDVLRALCLTINLRNAELPTMEEAAEFFREDDHDED